MNEKNSIKIEKEVIKQRSHTYARVDT